MIYACDACRFIFESEKEPERCPNCGNLEVRPAHQDEINEYKERRLKITNKS